MSQFSSDIQEIKAHIAEIDLAVEAIHKHQILEPPTSNCDEGIGNKELGCSSHEQAGPLLKSSQSEYCPYPDCQKGPLEEKPLRRHYATHVYCADVSIEDVQCVCCEQPLDRVSTFKQKHANCLERLKGGLSQETIAKAVKQKDRIVDAPNKQLDALRKTRENNLSKNPRKRVRGKGYEQSSAKVRRIEDLDATPAQHVPEAQSVNEINQSVNFREPGLDIGADNHTETFEALAAPNMASELFSFPQSTMHQYNGHMYQRSTAMLINPMDGVFGYTGDLNGFVVN